LLVVVVVTALGFDFTNGFHDTANAMATTIATGALKLRIAVGVASVLNFVGAFLSISVAATIAKGIVEQAADERDAQLIVLGSRGRSSVGSALLGDVARDVLQRARRPVLVVPSSGLAERRRGSPSAHER
jgi:nucleotide-binding universal stress UspA family protein